MTTIPTERTAGMEAPPELITAHIDALLFDILGVDTQVPATKVGWVARTHGEETASQLERLRLAQYGFCAHGHHRSVRTVRCGDCNKANRTEMYCWTCEHS